MRREWPTGSDRTEASRTTPVQSALPADAVAIIEPDHWRNRQGGKARDDGWALRFRSGLTRAPVDYSANLGRSDPTAHLALRFPSREAASRYAERQRLRYEVREPAPMLRTLSPASSLSARPFMPLCCWPTGPHALCCGNYPALQIERREKEDGDTS